MLVLSSMLIPLAFETYVDIHCDDVAPSQG
jgi:hypothetical protein